MENRKILARVGAIFAALMLCVMMVLPAAVPSCAYSNSGRTELLSPYQMTIAWWAQTSDGTATTVYERPLWNSFSSSSDHCISWFGELPGTTNGVVNELAYLEPVGLVDYSYYDTFAYHIGFNKSYNVSRVVIEMEAPFYNDGSAQDCMFKLGCLDAGLSIAVTMEGYRIERTRTDTAFAQTLTPFSYTYDFSPEAEEMDLLSLFPDDSIITKFQIVAASIDVSNGYYMNDLYIETPAWTVDEVAANNDALVEVLSLDTIITTVQVDSMQNLGDGIVAVASAFLEFEIAPGFSFGGLLVIILGVFVVFLLAKLFGGK